MKPLQRFGLIGFPVKHSFSAAMHNAAFAAAGINARYELWEVPVEQLGMFLQSLQRQGIAGLNVTIPHKERAVDFLAELSPEVHQIGAVNTICVRQNGTLAGFNTDCAGFARHIKALKARISRAALIGAGGAAKAVAAALAQAGTSCIGIYDVQESRRRELAEKINHIYQHTTAYAVDSVDGLDLREKTILINASPVGMKPEDPSPAGDAKLPSHLFVYDLIYNPAETPLLRQAKASGCGFTNGLMMLLYQGMGAFEHWVKEPAPEAVMREALEGELGECQGTLSRL